MKTSDLSLLTIGILLTGFHPLSVFSQAPSPGVNAKAEDRVPDSTQASQSGQTPNKTSAPVGIRLTGFSAGLDEIVTLTKGKVDESVVLTFVQSSPVAYQPSAQEIVQLRDMGIPSSVITALLKRGMELRERNMSARIAQSTAPAPVAVLPGQPTIVRRPVVTEYVSTPAPVNYSTVVYAPYPAYSYAPTIRYGYPGYYYPRYYGNYSYSCYPRVGFSAGFYPRVSLGLHFASARHVGFHGGFRGGFHGGSHRGFHGGFRGGGRHR